MQPKLIVIGVFCGMVSVLTIQGQPQATSSCTGVGCAALSQAELFIKALGGKKGLKTIDLALNEEARLAFYGIDATIVEVEKGRLSNEDGARIIENHKSRLRNIIDSKTTEAMFAAVGGQVSDIPAISKHLGTLLSIARQDQFFGREELAQQSQKQMMTVLTTFSQRFAETCDQQNFPVETALVLNRQNELMGTGVSVERCFQRMVTANFSDSGVTYSFEGCSSLTEDVDWDLKISGPIVGTGKGSSSIWQASFTYKGQKFEDVVGKLGTYTKEIEVTEEPPKVPADAGPQAKPNGRPPASVPEPPATKKKDVFKMRITAAFAEYKGQFYGGTGDGKWLETEVKREPKPCKAK